MKKPINEEIKRMQIIAGILKEEEIEEASPKYKDYKGGGGPSAEQERSNTEVLARELKKLGVPFIEDTKYAQKMYGEPDLLLKIIHPKTKKAIYAGYDRFGVTIDGPGIPEDEEMIDVSLEGALAYLGSLYGKKVK